MCLNHYGYQTLHDARLLCAVNIIKQEIQLSTNYKQLCNYVTFTALQGFYRQFNGLLYSVCTNRKSWITPEPILNTIPPIFTTNEKQIQVMILHLSNRPSIVSMVYISCGHFKVTQLESGGKNPECTQQVLQTLMLFRLLEVCVLIQRCSVRRMEMHYVWLVFMCEHTTRVMTTETCSVCLPGSKKCNQ